MTSRRFTFKPKPIIGAAARRPKDNLNIEHVDIETNIGDTKRICSPEFSKKESVEPSNTFEDSIINSELLLEKKSTTIEDGLNTKCSKKQSEEIHFEGKCKTSAPASAISQDSSIPEFRLQTDKQINDSFENEVLEGNNIISKEYIPNVSNPTVQERNCTTESDNIQKNDLETENTTESDISKKSINKLTDNNILKVAAEKLKVVSKYGRFRCKPVLSVAISRRKAEEPNENIFVDDVINSKIPDNGTGDDKLVDCVSNVNTVNTNLEPQKVNLQSNNDSGVYENLPLGSSKENLESCVSKPLSVVLSKPPSSPTNSIHKTHVPTHLPKPLDGNNRVSLQTVEHEEHNYNKKDTVDETKHCKEFLDEEKSVPLKEKSNSKNKRQSRFNISTFARMGQDAMYKRKAKFGSQDPNKNEMTMLDLIFYNPKSNPMTTKPISCTNVKKKIDVDTKESIGLLEETLEEQNVDDVDEPHAMPVPQLKVGPDGQVILDPESLIIETTDVKKNRENLENSEVVQETDGSYKSYFKRRSKRSDWSPEETLQFYRALNTLGTDFTLMASLFPKRSRKELKLKFKREEKVNLHLIDKAVSQPMEFDFKVLEEEMKREEELLLLKMAEKEKLQKHIKEEKERVKKLKETVLPKNRVKASAYKQFVEEDCGKFYTVNQQNERKTKNMKKFKTLQENHVNFKEEYESVNSHINNGCFRKMFHITKSGKVRKPKSVKEIKTKVNNETKSSKKIDPERKPCKRRKKLSEQNLEEIKKNKKSKMDELCEIDETNSEELCQLNETNRTIPGLFEEPWDLTVQPISDIEARILEGSTEENGSTSMISGLGSSFVDEVNNIDLLPTNFTVKHFTELQECNALPPYSSLVKLKNQEVNSSVNSSNLNTRLISESMKIIAELTSNVSESNDDNIVYIEHVGREEIISNTCLSQECLENATDLLKDPDIVRLEPSDNSNNSNALALVNVEVQMPFKIRQKQMKVSQSIPINKREQNKQCDIRTNTGISEEDGSVIEAVTDIEYMNKRLSDDTEKYEEIGSTRFSVINSSSPKSRNDVCYKVNSSSVLQCNISDNSNCIRDQTAETESDVLKQGKSFILNSDGVIHADNIAMLIPQFEIITGDCLGSHSSEETNLLSHSKLNDTNNFIILDPSEEVVAKTGNSSKIVISTLIPNDSECILGE